MIDILNINNCDTIIGMKSSIKEITTVQSVVAHGAIGDANYHHKFGIKKDETEEDHGRYWVGHYSKLVTMYKHEPYTGNQVPKFVTTYAVVSDNTPNPNNRQIRLSDIHPGYKSYVPKVGDTVVQYEAVNNDESIMATDDTEAFERAINAGDGYIFCPSGNYMVRTTTARKIKQLSGDGVIYLYEWLGGHTWYLANDKSNALYYAYYGYIDSRKFNNSLWRSMHWISDITNRFNKEEDFIGRFCPTRTSNYVITNNSNSLNTWFTVTPMIDEHDMPDDITVCISKELGSFYSTMYYPKWVRASETGINGSMFSTLWGSDDINIPSVNFVDCGDYVEVSIKKSDFFYKNYQLCGEDKEDKLIIGVDISLDDVKKQYIGDSSGLKDGMMVYLATSNFVLHCWCDYINLRKIDRTRAQYMFGYNKIWVKEKAHNYTVACDIGGDIRADWDPNLSHEEYIHEAYGSRYVTLTTKPTEIIAYYVDDIYFDIFLNDITLYRAINLPKLNVDSDTDYNTIRNIPCKLEKTCDIIPNDTYDLKSGTNILGTIPEGWWFWRDHYLYELNINDMVYSVERIKDGQLPALGKHRIWIEDKTIYINTPIAGSYKMSLIELDFKALDIRLLPQNSLTMDNFFSLAPTYNGLSDQPCKLMKTHNVVENVTVDLVANSTNILSSLNGEWYFWKPNHTYEVKIDDILYKVDISPKDNTLNKFGNNYSIWVDDNKIYFNPNNISGPHTISITEYELKILDDRMIPHDIARLDDIENGIRTIDYSKLKNTPCSNQCTNVFIDQKGKVIPNGSSILVPSLPNGWYFWDSNCTYRLTIDQNVIEYAVSDGALKSTSGSGPSLWIDDGCIYIWSDAEYNVDILFEEWKLVTLDYKYMPTEIKQYKDIIQNLQQRIAELESKVTT